MDLAAAAAAAADVAHCLEREFSRSDTPTRATRNSNYLIVGGIAKGTASAARVIDCLYILPPHVRHRAWSHDARAKERNIGLLGQIVAYLSHSFVSAHLTPAGWIAVETPSGTIVRLLPAVPMEGGGFRLARPATGIGRWHHTDPTAEQDVLQRANRISRGKATHLILLLKCWRRANDVAIHSMALERLAIEFVPQWPYRRRSLLFYDWMVRDFFFWAAHQGGRRVPLPGTAEPFDLGDKWVFDAEAGFAFAKRAGRLGSLGRWDKAMEHWYRIFGQPLDLLLGSGSAQGSRISPDPLIPHVPHAGSRLLS